MKEWQVIPEIVGCNAMLRMAAMQAIDAVELERHFVVEGEPGSGRRLLARSAWSRRSPGARSLFTLDCRMFQSDGAEMLLFGERSSSGPQLPSIPASSNSPWAAACCFCTQSFSRSKRRDVWLICSMSAGAGHAPRGFSS